MSRSTLPPLVGLDVGKRALHVATTHERSAPVHTLALTDAAWADQLAALVPRDAVVALEPTGWHYSNPVIALLNHLEAQVLMVEHRITRYIREMRVSGVKNDRTDARALHYAALQYVTEETIRGVKPAEPAERLAVTALRVLTYSYIRTDKETTRSTNRLRQLAHSIWPALGQGIDTYLRAVQAGFVTPRELHTLAHYLKDGQRPPGYEHHTTRQTLIKLAEATPPWVETDHLRHAIQDEAAALTFHQRRKAELEGLITDIVQRPPFAAITDLWMTVPRAGPIHIATLHAATRGQAAALTPDEFAACCGCHPRESRSGETKETKEARQGFKPAKRNLHLWALGLIQHASNPVAAYFARLESRGKKYRMAATRAKLCSILSGIARSGTPYRDDPQNQE